jgi:membrane-associated phospholipid phosphatase
MEAIHAWGLELIHRVQAFRAPSLDLAFRAITFLGNEEFFLLMFPFLYWCLDSRLGFRLGVLFFVSGYLNFALKGILAQPRPFDLEAGINLIRETGYGLPSGHAQSAVVLWGLLAHAGRRRWLWTPAAALMLLIGFSRVYLGVHFPTDVLAGWLIGAALLGAAILVLRTSAAARLRAPRWAWAAGVSLLAAVSLLALATKDTVSVIAAFWGFVLGYVLLAASPAADVSGGVLQRLLRLPAGLAVLLGLYLGLKALFPREGQPGFLAMRFVRYGLTGFWAGWGAPWLFHLLGLARGQRRERGSTSAQ